MTLSNYWPSIDEINKCIKSEAENVSDEVLLAVHQPFPLAYSKVGPDGRVMLESRTISNEEDFLNYFLEDAPSGCHVVPIIGASGVGKSHLIRILDARLRRLSNADKYLVIRIPKSASLRRVVELILNAEPLASKEYDQVKVEFSKALAEIKLDDAVVLFQAQLTIELNALKIELSEELIQNPFDSKIKSYIGHARDLPLLMSDGETVKHFSEKVFPRIIGRTVSGASLDSDQVPFIDSLASQFCVADLDLSNMNLGQANKQVANYYRLTLLRQDQKGKIEAVDVLNRVLNKAIQHLYHLDQQLGGMTLSDVIREIRVLLLAENKELVLLVEDFAALVGIQNTLANIIIQEGETSNGKELATIRSAIAVTDGYLLGKMTLATRAGREWVVEDLLASEAEALRRVKLLVASYLNAARIGNVELERFYRNKRNLEKSTDINWSPPVYSEFREENSKTLNAFGYSGDISLFPFTDASIECLARLSMTTGNALVFNPRFVIKNIIREILKVGRDAFVNHQFPPPGIMGKPASAEISQWLVSLTAPDTQKERYRRFVTIWAGHDPKSRSDIGRIAPEIFEAFELPVPDIEFVPTVQKIVSSIASISSATNDSTKLDLKYQVECEKYDKALETWVQDGTRLEMNVSNSIRTQLGILLNSRVDWNAERCRKFEFSRTNFSIPNAGGEHGIAADAIKIASDSVDEEGWMRQQLMSLLRYFEVYKGIPEYDGRDDDLVHIGNLFDRLHPLALHYVRGFVRENNRSIIMALSTNSRLLGISTQTKTLNGISNALFSDFESIEKLDDATPQIFKDWNELQLLAVQIRPKLQQLILEDNGCFQGGGKSAYGVDIVRLLDDAGDSNFVFEKFFWDKRDPELNDPLKKMTHSQISSKLKQVLVEARKIQKLIDEELGEGIDKHAIADNLQLLANTFSKTGRWVDTAVGFTPNEFVKICAHFRNSAIKDSLSILQGIDGEDDDDASGKKIARGAKLLFLPLFATERFLRDAKKLVSVSDQYVQTCETQFKDVNPDKKAKELIVEFNEIVAAFAAFQTEGK